MIIHALLLSCNLRLILPVISDYSIKTYVTNETSDDCTELELECQHTIDDFTSLWWEKDGDTLAEFDVSTGYCKPGIDGITCEATDNGHMLTIKDTRKTDSGHYTCVAQVDIGVTSSDPIEVVINGELILLCREEGTSFVTFDIIAGDLMSNSVPYSLHYLVAVFTYVAFEMFSSQCAIWSYNY